MSRDEFKCIFKGVKVLNEGNTTTWQIKLQTTNTKNGPTFPTHY